MCLSILRVFLESAQSLHSISFMTKGRRAVVIIVKLRRPCVDEQSVLVIPTTPRDQYQQPDTLFQFCHSKPIPAFHRVIGLSLSVLLRCHCNVDNFARSLLSFSPFTVEFGTIMTPDKTKRPLPSSTSMAFPEQPRTRQQWRLALQRVKLLYVRGQWKQCAARCGQLLSQAVIPVRKIGDSPRRYSLNRAPSPFLCTRPTFTSTQRFQTKL